ncbi:MAG: hypothetical protein JRN21_10045 [Nitrososphaerota archaeon]|nr:hypothetical protein [Nitrososphaerota archaeon]
MNCQWCHMRSSFVTRVKRDGGFISVECPHCARSSFVVNLAAPRRDDIQRLAKTKYFALSQVEKDSLAELMRATNGIHGDITFVNAGSDQLMFTSVGRGIVIFHFSQAKAYAVAPLYTSMEFDLSDLAAKNVPTKTMPNKRELAEAMSTLLERAQKLVSEATNDRPTRPTITQKCVQNPAVLTQLIDLAVPRSRRARPS